MAARTFSTAYGFHSAVGKIWAPLVIASALGLYGLAFNAFGATLLSAISTAYAVHHWPMRNVARVVMRLTDEGVDLDGVGHVPWERVTCAKLSSSPFGSKSKPSAITLTLDGTISKVAQPINGFNVPAWQHPIARAIAPSRLRIGLTNLFDSPDDIAAAYRTFLGDRLA